MLDSLVVEQAGAVMATALAAKVAEVGMHSSTANRSSCTHRSPHGTRPALGPSRTVFVSSEAAALAGMEAAAGAMAEVMRVVVAVANWVARKVAHTVAAGGIEVAVVAVVADEVPVAAEAAAVVGPLVGQLVA